MYNRSGDYFNNKEAIKSVLSANGYAFTDHENYISCSANYRNVSDTSSVVIYHKDNNVIDFASGWKGSVHDFLKLVTNQTTEEELDKYLKNNQIEISNIQIEPKIKISQKFDLLQLQYIDLNNNQYLNGRGINNETCKLFGCGFVARTVKGGLRNRVVIPVWNTNKKDLVGFVGRAVDDNTKPKVKIYGNKTGFVFPSYLNDKIIEQNKSVILVESQIDVLWMWQNGIKNVLCLFGTELSLGVLNYLLRKNVNHIVIATNNESSGIGNNAAIKIAARLKKYFDVKSIIIKLPVKKDFADMTVEELNIYEKELDIIIGK